MHALRFILFMFLFAALSCRSHDELLNQGTVNLPAYDESAGKGALLLTRFSSLEEFKGVVLVQYADDLNSTSGTKDMLPRVQLTYVSGGRKLSSVLKSGISQADFMTARDGNLWDRVKLGLKSPFAVFHKNELIYIESLGRRRPWVFGRGDVAFYDLAEAMVNNIREEDRIDMTCEDLSEKGYLNTFNHITAQAFMTSIFAERLADFVADVHEVYNMPELVTGNFTEAQLADFVNGPVDNYVDMINNEWGQELGKVLGEKYNLSKKTKWTPELLTSYLNDIQTYHSWAFQIGFKPFRETDDKILEFVKKINSRKRKL